MTPALRLGFLLTALAPELAGAQTPARPDDVTTIDGMIRAFYEVISGPPGQPRQWGRDSSLYIPGVRFVAMSLRDGRPVANITDHGQYIAQSDRFFVENGFFEREIGRVERRFGNIVHIFSSYETRSTATGPVTGRGINSIQLFWDGTRWWIANATWDSERPGNPIPPELLPRR